MKFQKWLFALAGVYGIVILLPFYWMERSIGAASPPSLTHVEYYYGFIGVALCWQFAFLLISIDPLRYRALMLLAILDKISFGIAAVILYANLRIVRETLDFACIDLALAIAFLAAYLRTPRIDPR